jgi:phage N-6-adenine-methyltransferase
MPNDEYYTPSKYIEMAREVLGGSIDLDPATCEFAQKIVKAVRYYTKEDDGLSKAWSARNVWMNPPYSCTGKFVDKLLAEFIQGNVHKAIVLVNNNTDTKWFHKLAYFSSSFCLTLGRISFVTTEGTKVGNRQGQVFFYLDNMSADKFNGVFCQIGTICSSDQSSVDLNDAINACAIELSSLDQ